MEDFKKYTVVASGKMRDVAFAKLDETVNLLGWQKGGKIPADEFDKRLAEADALFSTGNIKINEEDLAKARLLVAGSSDVENGSEETEVAE